MLIDEPSLSVQIILLALQNCTFARFKVYYINHTILVANVCTNIFKKTEKVSSLYINVVKEINLS